MKYFLALCVLTILSVFTYTAASNSFRSRSAAGPTADSTYSGDAQLSYMIEGRKVNIKSYLHTGGKNSIALYINQVIKIEGGMVRINLTNYLTWEVVNFLVADKGATHITHYSPTLFNRKENQGEFMLKLVNYYADDVTVQITDVDNKHVAGTFSGKFTSNSKKTILITDGHFDVPYKDDKLN
jgi:hypothetical protein